MLKIVANADIESLDILIAAHDEVATHLAKFSSEDAAINDVGVNLLALASDF